MSRQEELHEKIREVVDEGNKPSAAHLSRELGWPQNDVHRCLNILERDGKVFTYTKEALGTQMRLAGVKRE
ncbi:MAG: DNA-binding IclR family transcriptional regulator [Candidatus Nanohaloarchaea archaeon]|jgi:DNA-binding IclR family transcriptional regulator